MEKLLDSNAVRLGFREFREYDISPHLNYCPYGYDECWNGCCYPGRCWRRTSDEKLANTEPKEIANSIMESEKKY